MSRRIRRHVRLILIVLFLLLSAIVSTVVVLELQKANANAGANGTDGAKAAGAKADGTKAPGGVAVSQARPCDPSLEAIPESERETKLGTKQCPLAYPDKYDRVYLRVEASKYLGVVDGALRVVSGMKSAEAFKFKRVTPTKYTLATTTTSGRTTGVVTVDAGGAFYVRKESTAPSTLVVTGVAKRDVIAVHHARVDEKGAVVRSETDAVVLSMVNMDGTVAYGVNVEKRVADLLDVSIAQAEKLRAMRASCCSRFGPSCVDPRDAVLKPMCCTECKDTLDTCPELVRYDAGPLIQRDTCCKSIAMLGVTRVYGDSECAAAPGSCDREALIEYTRLSAVDSVGAVDGVYVPSFGEVAVARFLCNELYTI